MDIQIYRYKVEWYFKEEYSELPIDEVARGSDELSDEIDNLIESAYNKSIHFPVAARKLRDIFKRYYNDVSEGL